MVCGFKSHLPHQIKKTPCGVFFIWCQGERKPVLKASLCPDETRRVNPLRFSPPPEKLIAYIGNSPGCYKGAHKTVILKITIMASVRRDWERNNGYLVKAGYPLFFCRHEKQ